ncbi:MAG: DUF1553 domain-containing protein [Bryobacterales bacterium]|nr:DUF1553 domain-containing protein [Bryobacterales bacterium]
MRVTVLLAAALSLAASDQVNAPLETYKPVERRHWAFQPRQTIQPPAMEGAAWVKTPVDAFILEKLRKNELKPAPPADRATLLRRATFDMHGLPPTPEEIDAFVNDPAPNAWEKVVDRLLASPRYGEQWGRHWLDVVRFAESDGYEYDLHRPDAYRYRDYVVQSFNEDKPYNLFLTEQLAGDEIDSSSDLLRVASGFNRLGALRKNAGNQEVASSRNEVLTEMTNIVGSAFLGVTLGCARCHDHKFDPIRHTDYYRMQGFFAQTHADDILLANEQEQKAWKATVEPIEEEKRQIRRKMRGLEGPEKIALEEKLEELDEKMPAPLSALYSVKNDREKATPIHVLARGEHLNKGAKVGMRPLGVLLSDDLPELPVDSDKPRTRLAEWMTKADHPLTARVMANRIWHYHFGRGIVATPNDFGRMGVKPSHPELLDYLANQYVQGGWKMKPLHKMILLSSTYQQSSTSPMEETAAAKDAANTLLWKFNRRRLEAEELRDAMLAISGRLNAATGGPSVMLPIDNDLVLLLKRPNLWVPTKDATLHDRRSMYLIYKRNLRLPFMEVFDMPDMQFSCARREQSTHAPQALELLNGKTSNDLARSLAQRLLRERGTTTERIDYAFRLATGRLPTDAEKARIVRYLDDGPEDPGIVKEFALAVFNLNAFLYVN